MKLQTEFKIFGIRHHGAGSARRLKRALEEFKADVLLIELPSDSGDLVKALQTTDHIPPVAFLYYHKSNPSSSIYLPFAVFSPEYQAIRVAAEQKIPVVCIDLPASAFLHPSLYHARTAAGPETKYQHIVNDPIAYLASLDHFNDAERWWEMHFEQWHEHNQLFSILLDLMSELRTQSEGLDDRETMLREQHMRWCIRECCKNAYSKIAIVCGAWHAPVLTKDFLDITKHEEEPKLETADVGSCLIPWSYKHLSLNQHYTAGIHSPQWHESMFENANGASEIFLSKAARVLRNSGLEISTAAIIDASVFALQLSNLRRLPNPGLDELLDAAKLHFVWGLPEKLEVFHEMILCGDTTGQLPLNQQTLPFVNQFHERIQKLKLKPYWKIHQKDSLLLDLRKNKHLLVSRFLHYSLLIDLQWCNKWALDWNALGTFHEQWQFRWHPDLEMTLIQRGLLGNTLEDACVQYLNKIVSKGMPIDQIAYRLEHSLKADMYAVWPLLSDALDEALLEQQDYVLLSELIQPLLHICDYGSLHNTDVNWILKVLDKLIPKLVILIPDQTVHLKEDRARKMLTALLNVQHYFSRFPDHDFSGSWFQKLTSISVNQLVHPLLRGKCWSILVEKKVCSESEFLKAIQFEFSSHRDIPTMAFWLEGFISAQAGFFLLQPDVVQVLDKWVGGLEVEHFKSQLPLLRRCFSSMSTGEKQRIFRILMDSGNADMSEQTWYLDEQRSKFMLPLLKRFLIKEPKV
ncbi:MAG: hypothetical protein IPM34_04355 [Saprospiraceae bacterium]|nr:hypothetical protein [Saprospiraceae bacterium]